MKNIENINVHYRIALEQSASFLTKGSLHGNDMEGFIHYYTH